MFSPNFRAYCDRFFEDEFQLLVCNRFIQEFKQTIEYPELRERLIKNGFSCEGLLQKIIAKGISVNVVSEVNVCRDVKDNYLLALAKDGNADYLITRDKDLLTLVTFGKTRIVTMYDFEMLS
ncbi:MAG: putative toxin-antitoxin system toxin component, PIN family [Planctomycetaceae bacterium]|nr:putative toxin-antitoxin system toxin component, PIN family [Planctomycetaceae bacterium]